jgi:hypothetical protein
MSKSYAEKAIGVLGNPKDQRSIRDQQNQAIYGTCNSKEKYTVSGEGITVIPKEYLHGWEERSVKDKRLLAEYNSCNTKEGYDGPNGCQYAKLSDNPFNKLANQANRIPVSKST